MKMLAAQKRGSIGLSMAAVISSGIFLSGNQSAANNNVCHLCNNGRIGWYSPRLGARRQYSREA